MASCLALVWALALGAAQLPQARANSGTITANGPAVTAIISTPSAPAKFTFAGTAGEVVTVTASAGTFPSACDASVTLLNPTGTKIAGGGCNGTSGFIGETKLATAGTYAIVLSSGTGKTGQVTLSLSANAANGTITANGPVVTFTATHSGQGRDYTFTATAGEVVTLTASGGTYANACDESMAVLNASGAPVTAGKCNAGHTGFIGETTLKTAGTYIVDLIPTDGNTGNVTLSLSANPADSTITVNGPAVTFTATHSGQGRDYAFTATAGERVYLVAASGTYPGACDVRMKITNSSATNFGSACAGHSGTVSNVTLATAGNYIVDVIPQDGNVGSVKLSTYSCSTALCF